MVVCLFLDQFQKMLHVFDNCRQMIMNGSDEAKIIKKMKISLKDSPNEYKAVFNKREKLSVVRAGKSRALLDVQQKQTDLTARQKDFMRHYHLMCKDITDVDDLEEAIKQEIDAIALYSDTLKFHLEYKHVTPMTYNLLSTTINTIINDVTSKVTDLDTGSVCSLGSDVHVVTTNNTSSSNNNTINTSSSNNNSSSDNNQGGSSWPSLFR